MQISITKGKEIMNLDFEILTPPSCHQQQPPNDEPYCIYVKDLLGLDLTITKLTRNDTHNVNRGFVRKYRQPPEEFEMIVPDKKCNETKESLRQKDTSFFEDFLLQKM